MTAGKFADIVAVDGNPLDNFSALRTLGFVMKQGHIHRNDWSGTGPAYEPLPISDPADPAIAVDAEEEPF